MNFSAFVERWRSPGCCVFLSVAQLTDPSNLNRTLSKMSANTRKRIVAPNKQVKQTPAPVDMHKKQSSSADESAVGLMEPWTPSPYTVFKIIMSARLCAAAWNIVGDCDETYNYWEPTHYLMFGKGFQTWEYSPVYAIRSYAYLLLHTLPMRLYCSIFTPNPVMLFFFTRCILGFVCALCEVYFYKGVCHQFGNNVARIMLCFILLSAGMFISSTAYLPSSFCMYMTFLSVGAWFLERYEVAVMATAASGIVGWPFAALIGAPIAYDIILQKKRVRLFVMWSVVALATFLLPLVQIDQYYYGKLVVTPLNIVLYNVFTDHGPDLYGTEPLSYYFINGFLNFNVVFLMAVISLPFVLLINYITKENSSSIPICVTSAPMYLWILVFFTRPHKEERFLFPIYPFFILFGAVVVDNMQRFWHYLFPSRDVDHHSEKTGWIAIFIGIFFSLMSVSRVIALYQGYHAPLDIYVELNKIASDPKIHTLSTDRQVNVCVGKEWYRFPGSFFLPGPNWHLQFLRSEFKGQLPKPYSSEPLSTRIIPQDMNDMNKEEISRYTNISRCHYLVDLDLPRTTELEPRYSKRTEEWKILASIPFLDSSRSHKVFRAFYIPFVSSKYCVYENYNLLKTTRTKKTAKQRNES